MAVSEESPTQRPTEPAPLDVARIRADFPILSHEVRGKRLAYLDSAASSQRPRQVIEAVDHLYEHEYANIHRGVYWLSQRSTQLYEEARGAVAGFLKAPDPRGVIFTRGTTEAINLVARAWGGKELQEGDEVVVSHLEHHSNIVPWQRICAERGATLKVLPMTRDGELVVDALDDLLTDRTRLVAVTHVSNALGTVVPVKEIARRAHDAGALCLVDGAQAVPHMGVDVAELGCDFYAFSGHKMLGPTGIGALWGRLELLEAMDPYQSGGDMILSVRFEETTYAPPPAKFEAGTPDIAGAVGLAAAIRYLDAIGMDRVAAHEGRLLAYATERLREVPGLTLVGTAREKASVISFVTESAHPHDLGTILDRYGVAIRTGHHCAQPVMEFLGVPATARVSLALYNDEQDVDALIEALHEVRKIFT